jgi:hypothetical protein
MLREECLASYEGRGKLMFVDGSEVSCDFCAEHFPHRGIILWCDLNDPQTFLQPGDDSTIGFSGTTQQDGYRVRSDGRFLIAHLQFGSRSRVCYELRVLNVECASPGPVRRMRYGLTNF